jgi:hypothetical protein
MSARPATGPRTDDDSLSSLAPVQLTAAARRRVSRKTLSLAVLVVLLGGVLAYSAAQMLTTRTNVLAVARDVPVGATLTAADLVVASIPADPALTPVPATELSDVVGLVAEVPLVQGTLLTTGQIGTGSDLSAGEVLVALPLQDGQFPARGLSPGQQVLVVPTPGTNGVAAGATTDQLPDPVEATVAEVGPANATTQVTVVDVRVTQDDGVAVAELASTGNLAIVVLPDGA